MIDVNKITSVLAKLQDPQLQQYAQMHKNDPYIMALAMSESNRRKELRAASQARCRVCKSNPRWLTKWWPRWLLAQLSPFQKTKALVSFPQAT
jgi:hypothetical protein